jgi:hypothetical protein
MSIEKTLFAAVETLRKSCPGERDRTEGRRGETFPRKMVGELHGPARRKPIVELA